ncbi:carbon-monoxide dehydrogenase small subunit [Evansella vedderi]|uniref:Carbon-monoxide dehydrogenase small subunit n=1 Tax=Evansella vedderi TaxID=38282 RepID=A0ABT9ZR14_9BACI|nr:(2Fe-2S)-binding protein [Evansella vedderi]MDQ0252893.1 carbon-monoxide dehydrogenase small subunit [Evansella vedderi]
MATIRFKVNGKEKVVDTHTTKTLLDVLRDDLYLTGSKECCGKGECGSCSVMINDEVVCSCLVLVGQVEGEDIKTVEGVGTSTNMDIIQEAFIKEGATQCGYCTPGFIVAARSFLNKIEKVPTLEEIEEGIAGNICRCTGYTKIVKAIQTAAEERFSRIGAAVTQGNLQGKGD